MAIDGTGGDESDGAGSGGRFSGGGDVTVGEYTWNDLRRDVHTGGRFDRSEYLGYDPSTIEERLRSGASAAKTIERDWGELIEAERSFVVKDRYTWEHFKQEYYYEEDGSIPRDGDGEKIPFDPVEHLGFHPAETEDLLAQGGGVADHLASIVDERTASTSGPSTSTPNSTRTPSSRRSRATRPSSTATTWRSRFPSRRKPTSSRRNATG